MHTQWQVETWSNHRTDKNSKRRSKNHSFSIHFLSRFAPFKTASLYFYFAVVYWLYYCISMLIPSRAPIREPRDNYFTRVPKRKNILNLHALNRWLIDKEIKSCIKKTACDMVTLTNHFFRALNGENTKKEKKNLAFPRALKIFWPLENFI